MFATISSLMISDRMVATMLHTWDWKSLQSAKVVIPVFSGELSKDAHLSASWTPTPVHTCGIDNLCLSQHWPDRLKH